MGRGNKKDYKIESDGSVEANRKKIISQVFNNNRLHSTYTVKEARKLEALRDLMMPLLDLKVFLNKNAAAAQKEYQKVVDLRSMLKEAAKDYESLGRSTHKKDFARLIAAVEDISLDPSLSYEQRYEKMILAISAAYEKEKKHCMLSSIGAWWHGYRAMRNKSDAAIAKNFIKHLNEKTDSYHYPRILGCLLQEVVNKPIIDSQQLSNIQVQHAFDGDEINKNQRYGFLPKETVRHRNEK